jgi:hypothetical protein
MTKNLIKFVLLIVVFSMLLVSNSVQSTNLNTQQGANNKTQNISSVVTNNLNFSVSQNEELIYNVNSLLNNGTDYMDIMSHNESNNFDYNVGRIIEGDNIAFHLYGSDNNGTYDYVMGKIKGPNLHGDADMRYFLLNSTFALSKVNNPPLVYFVIPQDTNYTKIASEFIQDGYTVINNSTTFQISKEYTEAPQNFKVGQATIVVDTNVTARWEKQTGIMQYYYFNHTGGNASALEFSFLGRVDPGSLTPDFSFEEPELFYEITTLQVGVSNELQFSDMDENSYGSISEGQNILVSLHTNIEGPNGPYYDGEMKSITGVSEIMNPFSDNNDNGPRGLVFIFPVSTDAHWWDNISLWLTVDGLHNVNENESQITFMQSDPNNANNNVSITFDKATGLLNYYSLQTVDAYDLPGTNTKGVLNLELTFIDVYEFSGLNASFSESANDQYKYHIQTLNFNGSTTVSTGDDGTFTEGQDLHILFNSLSLTNGPDVETTMSTVTGQSTSNINYDIFDQNTDGPLVFFPILPTDVDGIIFDYFADVFDLIVSANVVNDGIFLNVSISDVDTDDSLHINHLMISWNATSGLMVSYDYDAVNPNDSNQVLKLKVFLVGESTGEVVYTAPASTNSTSSDSNSITNIITAPGYEFLVLFPAFVGIIYLQRKRKM